MKVIIAGGGIIGLCCAYFLRKSGYEIIVIDENDITSGTSFGNAGYVSPSHFIPLPTPGIVAQGLRWMLNSSSPFYIKPRLSPDLIKFCFTFWKNANRETIDKNAPHLHNLLDLSRELTIQMRDELGNTFRMKEDGCLMLYKSTASGKHEIELAETAKSFNIETRILNSHEVRVMEPMIDTNVAGGVYYPVDCHLHPGDFMKAIKEHLEKSGVKFILNHAISGFEKSGDVVNAVIVNGEKLFCEQLILATGSWLPVLAKKLGIPVLMQAGKGYSLTFQNIFNNLRYPAILVDKRVAMTPMGNDLRMGGTMEISGLKSPLLVKRARAIFDAAKEYYPGLNLSFPMANNISSGLRPLTPDGLPYIGRSNHYKNILIASGHAMLGLSLAAATGKLVEEILSGKKTSVNTEPFRINRFN
ncbi:MAG: FAD-dependent oxidoreductase [Ginsengibacter sp.]